LYFGGCRQLNVRSIPGRFRILRVCGTENLAGKHLRSYGDRIAFTSNQVVYDAHQGSQPPSRLQQILSSCDPIRFIVPDVTQSRELSAALRIAHDLNVHHRLDAEIVLESEALPLLDAGPWSDGNIVFIGKPSSEFVRRVLEDQKTPFGVASGLRLKSQALDNGCCM